ncbi:DinB family protein [Belliella kenyensis]|uniref:DinB family protein n=1 Tax=Belliella kenyensis TaxID=1472724 RepID=A0ABV8EQ50_9BACT|nr:DinB family protein [Belliella kenyensis]MCH7400883.1 DinB family protein [Belliella kenyensis]MDN3601831.1 DinB family protein [Belliella kenyensis]
MKEKLLTILENSRNYTLAVANAMPEAKFSFKLVNESWEFGDLLNHIAYGIEWWDAHIIRKIETEWNPPMTPKTKDELLKYIDKSFGILKDTLQKSEMTDEDILAFNSAFDHITHHRGQAVLFLRQNNITPPEYAY